MPFAGTLSLQVPNAPALLGARFVTQVFNVNAERPVFVVVTR